jgi:hypothetical protein
MSAARPYRAFGLNILSEIEMPQWTEGTAPWDVSIRWGTVPASLPDAVQMRDVCWARPDSCLLTLPHLGRLLVESGNRLTAALNPGGTPAEIGTLIAGTGMATALYQRGRLCLHASGVAKDGRAILIAGYSGAGKSTLASALVQRGFDFISDDVCAIEARADGQFEVVQSYPSLRLHDDSYGQFATDGLWRTVDPLDEKHRLQPAANTGAPVRAVVTRICHLQTGPVSVPTGEAIRGIERVELVQKNLFRPRLATIVGDKRRLLEMSVGLGQQLEVRRIVRPPAGFALDRLCALAVE